MLGLPQPFRSSGRTAPPHPGTVAAPVAGIVPESPPSVAAVTFYRQANPMSVLWRSFAPDTLAVREDQRTIIGVAVPFNTPTEVADYGDTYREQFAAGAFARTIAERGPNRVKLLLQHDDRRLPIGRAVALTETPSGLLAELAVSRTPDGDMALELARDGTLDGLSIGFQPVAQTRSGDLVTRTEVKLREISLTGFPAYDTARVQAIRSKAAAPDPHAQSLAIARGVLALAHYSRTDTTMTSDNVLVGVIARRDAIAADLQHRLDSGDRVDPDWITRTADELDDLNKAISDRQEAAVRDERAAAMHRQFTPVQSRVSVTGEARTYAPAGERSPDAPDFLRDLFAAQVLQDPEAGARLARHGREVQAETPALYERAVNSGGAGSFVPPEYLVSAWAEYVRAGRPTANLATQLPLPEEGMVVNVPQVTTATATGVQVAEGDTLANQDLDTDTLPIPVRTIGGYVDLTRQAIERGQLFESVVMGDLAADYAAKLDAQVLNGTGADGQHLGILNTVGINAVTYTDASPTLVELWPKMASAVGQVVSQRFSGPTAAILHPNTWAWMLSTLDANGRPLVTSGANGPNNAAAISTVPQYEGTAGTLMGLPVVLDGNLPTNLGVGGNETRIIIADMRDALLIEDPNPVQARFDSPGSASLKVRLVIYGYSAFTAARLPKAVSVIAGTGLITPAL